jgi:hypothetical protein
MAKESNKHGHAAGMREGRRNRSRKDVARWRPEEDEQFVAPMNFVVSFGVRSDYIPRGKKL